MDAAGAGHIKQDIRVLFHSLEVPAVEIAAGAVPSAGHSRVRRFQLGQVLDGSQTLQEEGHVPYRRLGRLQRPTEAAQTGAEDSGYGFHICKPRSPRSNRVSLLVPGFR